MGQRPQVDPALVEALQELVQEVKRGEVTDAFIVMRYSDGEYDSTFYTADLPDMLLQVRTEIFRAQTAPFEPSH